MTCLKAREIPTQYKWIVFQVGISFVLLYFYNILARKQMLIESSFFPTNFLVTDELFILKPANKHTNYNNIEERK